MADKTTNGGDPTPKPIGRATFVMIGVAVLLVIIAIVLLTSFFKSPTGETQPANAANTQSR